MGKDRGKNSPENENLVENEDFYLRVRVKNRSRNVMFNTGEELDYNLFVLRGKIKDHIHLVVKCKSVHNLECLPMFLALRAHNLRLQRDTEVELFDQLNTPLDSKMVDITLRNFKSWLNTGFFIEMRITGSYLSEDIEVEVCDHFQFVDTLIKLRREIKKQFFLEFGKLLA